MDLGKFNIQFNRLMNITKVQIPEPLRNAETLSDIVAAYEKIGIRLPSVGKPDSDTSANDNKHVVIKSVCLNCKSEVEPILHTYRICPKCTHEF